MSFIEEWKKAGALQEVDPDFAIHLLEEAESLISAQKTNLIDRASWVYFLDTTKKPAFLKALKEDAARIRWAEAVFSLLQITGYSLRDMMDSRVNEHPDRILFREMPAPKPVEWSYEQIQRHLREIASVFYHAVKSQPRVAIYSDNCLESACTDIACLCYDIFDTPLSLHFSAEILVPIFDQLKINIAVTDSRDRYSVLLKVKAKTKTKFKIFTLPGGLSKEGESFFLPKECKKLSGQDIDKMVTRHATRKNTEVATTMFTSGSTGLPKGVSFSIYNIVSKRFARAAALPGMRHTSRTASKPNGASQQGMTATNPRRGRSQPNDE